MNDRELLELAAKAAGIDWWRVSEGWCSWNPLTDDGDALRLAVKLCLRITCHEDGQVYIHKGAAQIWNEFALHENSDGERNAATRRAIVRAAAEIGKDMKC